MSSPENHKTIEVLLSELHTQLEALCNTLTLEKSILQKHKLNELEPILTLKETQFDILNITIQKLKNLLDTHSLDFNKQGMETLLQGAPTTLMERWNRFITALQCAQETNLINGMLVMGMKNYNDRLLNLLTQTTETYHPNQQSKHSLSTRQHKV
ncbi:MAG: flagella synthesis protein FlgN [Candidatus Berkiella sp.]|jgi:flagellar biosynthesis/type III secretory pathway chaperone